MVITTYRVATIPLDWHSIMRSRSSKVIDFNVIWKPVFDFLLVINSNLGPILHRLATIHLLQRMTTDDNRVRCLQDCCHLARFDSSRHFQHEGTTWAGPWRWQAGWRFDVAAMELWAQHHLGHHSGRHSGKSLSAAECNHYCQCRWACSCQKKEQVHLTQRHSLLFPVALETFGPMSVSIQEFLVQIGRSLTEVMTDLRETTFYFFQRLLVTVQHFNMTWHA